MGLFEARDLEKSKAEKSTCIGTVFKCTGSQWATDEGVFSRKAMRIAKRKSCPGCADCGWLMEYIKEDVAYHDDINFLNECEPDKYYSIRVNSSQDWESGHWEIDDWEFVEDTDG